MAFGTKTLDSFSAAANDIFQGQATANSIREKAAGTRLQAEGTRINAEGIRLNATGLRLKATGTGIEGENYDSAAVLAHQNEQFTRESFGVKEMMADREIYQTIGGARADIAASGFQRSGSAIDLLRASAAEGAMTKSLLQRQGLITEEGYKQQAKSYENLAGYARFAQGVENDMAAKTDTIAARTDVLASKTDDLADQMDSDAKDVESNSYISAGIHALTGITSIFLP
jgi:hypothetical protein